MSVFIYFWINGIIKLIFFFTARKCEEKLTLSTATKNFIARLTALKRVLENLEQNKTVTHLIDDVNNLHNAANQDSGLNTGGTFEWVDSVLVKVRSFLFLFLFLPNIYWIEKYWIVILF